MQKQNLMRNGVRSGMGDLAEKICRQALSCGFDQCGIVPLSALEGFHPFYEKRLNDVPMSSYFYESVGKLDETKERFPWAKSIVVLILAGKL